MTDSREIIIFPVPHVVVAVGMRQSGTGIDQLADVGVVVIAVGNHQIALHIGVRLTRFRGSEDNSKVAAAAMGDPQPDHYLFDPQVRVGGINGEIPDVFRPVGNGLRSGDVVWNQLVGGGLLGEALDFVIVVGVFVGNHRPEAGSQILPDLGQADGMGGIDHSGAVVVAHGHAHMVVLPFSHHRIDHLGTAHHDFLHIPPAEIGIGFQHQSHHAGGERAGGGSAGEVIVVAGTSGGGVGRVQRDDLLGVAVAGPGIIPFIRGQGIAIGIGALGGGVRADRRDHQRKQFPVGILNAAGHFYTAGRCHHVKGSSGRGIGHPPSEVGNSPYREGVDGI